MRMLENLVYSLRLIRKTPAFSLVTLLVIVLGLSLYLISYTFTRQIAEEPMPFPAGDRYVTLGANDARSGFMLQRSVHDALSFSVLNNSAQSYDLLGAYQRSQAVISGEEFPQRFRQVTITPELLAATAVPPLLGRMFSDNESSGATAIISHQIWENFYSASSDIVGRVVEINGEPATIIAVMPEGFGFPRGAEFWTPLESVPGTLPGEDPLSIVGILKADTSASEAREELTTIMQGLFADYPEYDTNRTETILPYASLYPWGFSLPDIMLYIAWIVLGLAVVNLSSLLVVRLASRKQELAIRSSMGASGTELIKQVLLETLLFCSIGLVLTLVTSSVLLQVLKTAWGVDVPYWVDFKLDAQGVIVASITTLLVWLFSGIAIAYRAYTSKPGELSANTSITSKGFARSKSSQFVVALEVVLSSFLLVCCGGAIYLFQLAYNTDYGVDVTNMAVASFSFTSENYEDNLQRSLYLENLLREVEMIPGVSEVTATSTLPHRMGTRGTFRVEEIQSLDEDDSFRQSTISIVPNYFSTAGVNILEGRPFESTDTVDSQAVAIITDEFAEEFWPAESAIGKQLLVNTTGVEELLTVIGVVPLILQAEYDFERLPSIYRPIKQFAADNNSLVLRYVNEIDASELDSQVKSAALIVDRNLPVGTTRSLRDQITIDTSGVGGFALLFVEFTIATLVLASIGIYTVIARSIYLRTQEIGIRRALGSSNLRLTAKFLTKGIYFLVFGIVLGAIPATLLSVTAFTVMEPIGAQVIAYLPAIAASSILFVSLLVLLSSYIPVKNAINLEPGDALRYE